MPELQPFDDERVSAYIDGELTSAEREQFERLIAQRPDYRQAIDELRTLRERMQALPAHGLSEDFATRVLRKAELATLVGPGQPAITKEPARWLTRNKAFVLIAGLAACLLAMVVLPYQTRKEPAVAAVPVEKESAATREAISTGTRGGEMVKEMRDDESRLDLGVASTDHALEEADSDVAAMDDAPTADLMAESVIESAPESMIDSDGDDPHFQPVADGFAGPAAEDEETDGAVLELVEADDPEYQRLTEEARGLLQQIEPENADETWDIVVATELRDANDWRMLNTALVSNQLQLQDLTATPGRAAEPNSSADEVKSQSEQAVGSFGGKFDAQRFNEQFFSKLQANEVLKRRTRAKTKQLVGKDQRDEVDTHLLYVEGTTSQIANFMQSLPGAQAAQLHSNLRSGTINLADKANSTRLERLLQRGVKGQDDAFRSATAADQRMSLGRAVHLGQSSTKIATLNARQERAAVAAAPPVPSSAQPIDRAQSAKMSKTVEGAVREKLEVAEDSARDAADGEEEPMLRGLIILQDVTEPINGPINGPINE